MLRQTCFEAINLYFVDYFRVHQVTRGLTWITAYECLPSDFSRLLRQFYGDLYHVCV